MRTLTHGPHRRQIIYPVQPLHHSNLSMLGRSLTASSRACRRAKRLYPPENLIVFLPIFLFFTFIFISKGKGRTSPWKILNCPQTWTFIFVYTRRTSSPLALADETDILLHFWVNQVVLDIFNSSKPARNSLFSDTKLFIFIFINQHNSL